MPEHAALEVRGLTRVFRVLSAPAPFSDAARRGAVHALKGLDLDVKAGSVTGLLGPNGSGKTTALRCCLGVLRPSAGMVRVFGAPPRSDPARRGVGFAPERFQLAPRRSGRETLVLLARLQGASPARARADAAEQLERFGLTDAADRALGTYSKGMTRRVALGAALLGNPRLLVLDEPFDGLDPIANLRVRDEIARRARDGAAILVTSHAMADLESVATHLVVLDEGRVLAAGTLDDVLGRPGEATLRVAGLDAEALAALERDVLARGGCVLQRAPARETLEEFFRRRLGRDVGSRAGDARDTSGPGGGS